MDFLKGFGAPWIAIQLVLASGGNPAQSWIPLVAGLLAIVGHSFTCFAGFRGGKGVLTAFGVFCALCAPASLASFAVWIALTFFTGYVSLGSILGCVTLVVMLSSGYFQVPWLGTLIVGEVQLSLLLVGVAVAVFVIVKHKANIVRLLNGTENGFRNKKKTETPGEVSP